MNQNSEAKFLTPTVNNPTRGYLFIRRNSTPVRRPNVSLLPDVNSCDDEPNDADDEDDDPFGIGVTHISPRRLPVRIDFLSPRPITYRPVPFGVPAQPVKASSTNVQKCDSDF